MAKQKPRLSLGTIPPPPPPSAPTAEQAAFQAGERRNVQTSKPPNASASKSRTWERFTLYLPPDVAKALRHKAVDAGQDMSDVAAAALRAALGV